jgi:hypothetical protein
VLSVPFADIAGEWMVFIRVVLPDHAAEHTEVAITALNEGRESGEDSETGLVDHHLGLDVDEAEGCDLPGAPEVSRGPRGNDARIHIGALSLADIAGVLMMYFRVRVDAMSEVVRLKDVRHQQVMGRRSVRA